MPVTLTQEVLSSALRLGDTPEEIAEATRLLSYATAAVARHLGDAFDDAPDAVANEGVIRLSGFLFDQPNAGRGVMYADALRSSGAAMILLPYKVIRAGSTGEALEAARQAAGVPGNPVTGVVIESGELVVTLADGSVTRQTLPAGMGGAGEDQAARDAAADAQATADGATTSAANAQAAANSASDAAAAAQGAIAAHERAPHNTDGTARTAASAAQARADDAFALADEKVDTTGAASAAREVTADWAENGNPDPIPAPKLANVINAHEDIVNVLDGRLPGPPVAMRLGWSQRADFIAADFARPSPPIGGSIAGMSDGLAAPPFPPGLASDPTLFLGIWLAGDPDVVEISGGGAQFGNKRPLTLEGGKVGGDPGVYLVSTARLRPLEGTIFSVTITGPRIVTESDLAAHASDPDAHHVPPTGMGGRPTVLYEAATAAIAASAGLIAGNVVCPETGDLEFYFQGLTGTRQGAVAYARIPAARIRAVESALNAAYSNDSVNLLAIPHGANRGIGIAVQATTNFLMLSAQAPGNFFIRIAHIV